MSFQLQWFSVACHFDVMWNLVWSFWSSLAIGSVYAFHATRSYSPPYWSLKAQRRLHWACPVGLCGALGLRAGGWGPLRGHLLVTVLRCSLLVLLEQTNLQTRFIFQLRCFWPQQLFFSLQCKQSWWYTGLFGIVSSLHLMTNYESWHLDVFNLE